MAYDAVHTSAPNHTERGLDSRRQALGGSETRGNRADTASGKAKIGGFSRLSATLRVMFQSNLGNMVKDAAMVIPKWTLKSNIGIRDKNRKFYSILQQSNIKRMLTEQTSRTDNSKDHRFRTTK